VTPEAQYYLNSARQDIDDTRKILAAGVWRIAARSAYYAAFHAAEALIVERTGRIAKTHSGVRAEFARLVKNSEPDRALSTFLAQAYKYKEISDYGTGDGATVSQAEATQALKDAEQFIARISEMLASRL
jgi:uncharacterized protein (UPF0332 family)